MSPSAVTVMIEALRQFEERDAEGVSRAQVFVGELGRDGLLRRLQSYPPDPPPVPPG